MTDCSAQKFKAELDVNCKNKAADWAERSKLRSEEVAAISEAISVLNDDDALDMFNKTLKKPAALVSMGFLQKNTKSSALKKAKTMLESLNKVSKTASPALSLLANTVVSKINNKMLKNNLKLS